MRARPHGGAVHGGHRGLVQLPELADEGLHPGAQCLAGGPGVKPLPPRARHRRGPQVHPGAEGVAHAGHQQGAHLAVGPGLPDAPHDLVAHRHRERVLGLGAVEDEPGHRVLADGVADHRANVGHGPRRGPSAGGPGAGGRDRFGRRGREPGRRARLLRRGALPAGLPGLRRPARRRRAGGPVPHGRHPRAERREPPALGVRGGPRRRRCGRRSATSPAGSGAGPGGRTRRAGSRRPPRRRGPRRRGWRRRRPGARGGLRRHPHRARGDAARLPSTPPSRTSCWPPRRCGLGLGHDHPGHHGRRRAAVGSSACRRRSSRWRWCPWDGRPRRSARRGACPSPSGRTATASARLVSDGPRAASAGQAEDAVADHRALDLGGAAGDGGRLGPQPLALPGAADPGSPARPPRAGRRPTPPPARRPTGSGSCRSRSA